MPEYKLPVRPVKVEYTCDYCGAAPIKYTPPDTAFLGGTRDERHVHTCTNPECNQLHKLDRIYPHIRYEPQ